ncbi:hypothetical protein GCM10012279_01680 [Micromonospora yangpuensis]|uniref:Phospholipase_D-nuclease N-terminal n=1 Tax=Micromonospora yangpuensis TaxID=683228 RepID=A0A1C6UAB2_9ACTN|nr:hypothetical protein GCM10012279_01680 [Micromonospora yangpuensis]SCL50972.1 Phospholipase_D-nuclease N-terminal [Micromonospora yangpuensis]
MVRLFILLFFVQVVCAALALISCLSAEKGTVRAMPRPAWVAVILLVPLLGWIAWFLAGRPRPVTPIGTRPARGPAAPDDDPEFLRAIAERAAKQDHDLFRRLEEDLRDQAGPATEPGRSRPAAGPTGERHRPAAGATDEPEDRQRRDDDLPEGGLHSREGEEDRPEPR